MTEEIKLGSEWSNGNTGVPELGNWLRRNDRPPTDGDE